MSTAISAHPDVDAIADQDRVVVGFDGSAGAEAAVQWAAREAALRGATLRVVTCWAVPPEVDYTGLGQQQTACLDAIVATTRRRHPRLRIDAHATHLDPRDVLMAEAAAADLLVIGSSTSSAGKHLLLGSVSHTAARRSPCPVVVVRGDDRESIQRILVAVDGSNAAGVALDWACEEATRHHSALVVAHAWERDTSRDHADHIVERAVRECRQRTQAEVRGVLLEGPAARTIVEASRSADLVAIGSRGRSGFKTALFGSVALSVAEHAACPVLVTHPRLRREETGCSTS